MTSSDTYIHGFSTSEQDRLTRISVTGNAFLYKMVRRLVGYLVAVGSGKIDGGMTEAILDGSATAAFDTAPAQGLFLEEVFYDHDAMLVYRPEQLPFMIYS